MRGRRAKKSRRSRGQYKAPHNFKLFKDSVAVKLIEVFDTSHVYIYTQIKGRQLLGPPHKIRRMMENKIPTSTIITTKALGTTRVSVRTY